MQEEILAILKANCDKIGLGALFLICLSFTLHASHHGDSGIVAWITNLAGQILAALLTLITGARQQARKTDGNGNGVPPLPGGNGNGHGV